MCKTQLMKIHVWWVIIWKSDVFKFSYRFSFSKYVFSGSIFRFRKYISPHIKEANKNTQGMKMEFHGSWWAIHTVFYQTYTNKQYKAWSYISTGLAYLKYFPSFLCLCLCLLHKHTHGVIHTQACIPTYTQDAYPHLCACTHTHICTSTLKSSDYC